MKNTQCLDGINSKVKKAEENVNVPENKEIEAIQNETESNWKKKWREHQWSVEKASPGLMYGSWAS